MKNVLPPTPVIAQPTRSDSLPTVEYRGFQWSAEHSALSQWIDIYARTTLGNVSFWRTVDWPCDTSFDARIEQLARALINEVLDHDIGWASIDEVPWEIHLINDPVARAFATEAFLTAVLDAQL